MNLLTDDLQRGYRSNKSPTDVIFHINQEFARSESDGQVLFDLSQTFGEINSDKIRRVLYGK